MCIRDRFKATIKQLKEDSAASPAAEVSRSSFRSSTFGGTFSAEQNESVQQQIEAAVEEAVSPLQAQLREKKEECTRYAGEIHKLTHEMSEMNDRAIKVTMEHNDATDATRSEIASLKKETIPALEKQIEELTKTMASREDKMRAVEEAEQEAFSKVKVLQEQLDEQRAEAKAREKKAANNIKELKQQFLKEAGNVKMLQAELADSKDELNRTWARATSAAASEGN
eukprot:TRINITY_DN10393_c0_g1_i1.p1 TRINITY_DN10393_c0_g1~~TRINITY_DN10393_c0_g1_i1.p1  ORF type:complete len:226 (-),score=85.65 TRINITY_DN10393_c0_g1_i1:237-914(-)